MSFVVLLCTFSRHSMYFLRYGSYTWTQYSRCGRIYVLYSVLKLSISIWIQGRPVSVRALCDA